MEKIDLFLLRLGAKYESKSCRFLKLVLIAALEYESAELPTLKHLQTIAAQRIGNARESCISRGISRAVLDIWNYGDREYLNKLYHRKLIECPTPKSFICVAALHLKQSQNIH